MVPEASFMRPGPFFMRPGPLLPTLRCCAVLKTGGCTLQATSACCLPSAPKLSLRVARTQCNNKRAR